MSVQEVFEGKRRWGVAIGDCSDSLRQMPANSVHCCVTSPPYYGLRSYLPAEHQDKAKEIGLEETPEKYVERMVGVFREVKRVLRDDGVLWLNVGDSYSQAGGCGLQGTTSQRAGRTNVAAQQKQGSQKAPPGYKPKDRIGIPHMLAFAMRADGWFFRDEIIWAKRNPMPSSTQDRTTCAHEFVFMFSKRARYYYDGLAIAEKSTNSKPAGNKSHKYTTAYGGGADELHRTKAGLVACSGVTYETRNKRSVWPLSSAPYKGSHYATFPPKLVEPCILAGTSAAGCCPACGAPWVRVVERKRVATRPGKETKVTGNRDPQRHVTSVETTGWQQACGCEPAEPASCTVLDPFVGSGTTLEVAVTHGRRAVGCDLDERNMRLIRQRMQLVQPLIPMGV